MWNAFSTRALIFGVVPAALIARIVVLPSASGDDASAKLVVCGDHLQ